MVARSAAIGKEKDGRMGGGGGGKGEGQVWLKGAARLEGPDRDEMERGAGLGVDGLSLGCGRRRKSRPWVPKGRESPGQKGDGKDSQRKRQCNQPLRAGGRKGKTYKVAACRARRPWLRGAARVPGGRGQGRAGRQRGQAVRSQSSSNQQSLVHDRCSANTGRTSGVVTAPPRPHPPHVVGDWGWGQW